MNVESTEGRKREVRNGVQSVEKNHNKKKKHSVVPPPPKGLPPYLRVPSPNELPLPPSRWLRH